MLKTNELNNFFLKAKTLFVCIYIILAPIFKCIPLYMFGYSIIVPVIILMCIIIFLGRLSSNNLVFGNFSLTLMIVYAIELFLIRKSSTSVEIGLVLSVFLYISLLTMRDIPLKTVYISFFIAAFLSAIFSFIYGTETGEVTRTAVNVDGSISVITLVIILLGENKKNCDPLFNIMKVVAFFSSLVVLMFGMSRARIAITVIIFAFWILKSFMCNIANGIFDTKKFLALIGLIAVFFVLQSQPVVRSLIESISKRFEDGFSSTGRADEIHVGIELFKNNMFSGAGWGTLKFRNSDGSIVSYYNHCMYVAALARGGLLFGIPFALSLFSILRKTLVRRKNIMLLILTGIFFALGYGNAGIFNYTICSMLVPISIIINESETDK